MWTLFLKYGITFRLSLNLKNQNTFKEKEKKMKKVKTILKWVFKFMRVIDPKIQATVFVFVFNTAITIWNSKVHYIIVVYVVAAPPNFQLHKKKGKNRLCYPSVKDCPFLLPTWSRQFHHSNFASFSSRLNCNKS